MALSVSVFLVVTLGRGQGLRPSQAQELHIRSHLPTSGFFLKKLLCKHGCSSQTLPLEETAREFAGLISL